MISGRPKGLKNTQTLINQRVNKKTFVVERGRRKEITMAEFIIAKLVNDAAAGGATARREVLKLMSEIKEGTDQKGYTILYLDEADRNA